MYFTSLLLLRKQMNQRIIKNRQGWECGVSEAYFPGRVIKISSFRNAPVNSFWEKGKILKATKYRKRVGTLQLIYPNPLHFYRWEDWGTEGPGDSPQAAQWMTLQTRAQDSGFYLDEVGSTDPNTGLPTIVCSVRLPPQVHFHSDQLSPT